MGQTARIFSSLFNIYSGGGRLRKVMHNLFYVMLLLLLLGLPQVNTVLANSISDSLPAGLLASCKIYVAPRIDYPLDIDGKLNDKAWQKAPWSDLFEDIAGLSIIKGTRKDSVSRILPTQVKICWDHHYLYIGARLMDPNLQATLHKRDTIIYHDNDFEVFFTTSPEVNTYYELEVNQLGTLLDLLMPKPYRSGGNALIHWDLKGLKLAVALQGSLNNAQDKDTGWTVEMAIPYTGILPFGAKSPKAGDYWRINFSRVQWDGHNGTSGWERNKGENGELLREHNWVWSPQGIIDMHAPDRWGYLFFETDSTTKPELPLIEIQKKALWDIYYRQQIYRMRHGKFALTLAELGISATVELRDPASKGKFPYSLQLTAGKDWFRLSLLSPAPGFRRILSLDQNGLVDVSVQRK